MWQVRNYLLAGLIALVVACAAFAQQTRNPDPQARPTVKIDVDVVVVPVTVVDRNNRYVASLSRENFHVWEDKAEQQILEFSQDDAPMSLGILLDTSGSMTEALPGARRNAGECLETGAQGDEYF
ncbi:MAG TPA: hypothetical protein VFY29_07625, partial [Terriglobia bacterium]|nr:hypothetical protein [Terriglobia bacterium]